MVRRNYKKIALDEKDTILELINLKKSKTEIASILGITRKTLLKVLSELNIDYNYFKSNRELFYSDEKGFFCKKFKRNKEETTFYSFKKQLNYCIECWREITREKYYDNRKDFAEFKSSIGCCKCNEKRHYVLDFHHIDEKSKKFNISDRARASIKNSEIQEEINKCVLLCSNCHREYHYLGFKNINDFLS